MSTYAHSNRGQRNGGSYTSNDKRVGVYHRGVNALTRLSGPKNNTAPIVSRNVPRPIQTCSLRKENGGQDVSAVIVNRNNGSGKKVGWGSALKSESSTPSNSQVSSTEPSKDKSQSKPIKHEKHYPPLPPPPTASDKNVPWALHPPNTSPTTSEVLNMERSPPNLNQEKGEENLQQIRCSDQHNLQDHSSHDRHYLRPHSSTYNDNEYVRGERYSRRYTEDPRSYSREHIQYSRVEYRGHRERDYRGRYDPRYEFHDRDHRSYNNAEKYNSSSTADLRNQPNSYYQSKEVRWGDDDDNDSAGNKSAEHGVTKRYHREDFGGESGNEREKYFKNRNYESSARAHSSYSSARNGYESHHRFHPHYYEPRNSDDPRLRDKVPSKYAYNYRNEEDVGLQAIREREVAETCAKQREIEHFRMEKKSQSEKSTVPSGPIILLRNKQTSGESSCGIADVEQSLNEGKNQSQNNEIKNKGSESNVKVAEEDINDVKNTNVNTFKTESKQEAQKSRHVKDGDADTENKVVNDCTDNQNQCNNKLGQPCSDEQDVHGELCNFKSENQIHKNIDSCDRIEKNDDDQKSYEAEMPIDYSEENLEESHGDNQNRKAFEQQNVLRQVAASRGSKSKRNSAKKKVVNKQQRTVTEGSEDKDEKISQNKLESEAAAKAARDEHRLKRGPRTKGVLYRRLPDGTFVNADLSDEEIGKLEEKKKVKLAKQLAREARAKAREKDRNKAKNKEQNMMNRDENKKNQKDNTRKEKATSSQDNSTEVPKSVSFKPKSFVPAPAPAVSAWEAGPPRSVIEANLPVPSEVPLKSSEDLVIEDITSESDNGGSSVSNPTFQAKSSLSLKSDEAPAEAIVKQLVSHSNKHETSWKQAEEHQHANEENHHQFTPINPIALPNVATWNFGDLFAPPQKENCTAHGSWDLRNESDAIVGKPIPWAASSAHETLGTHEDDDVAALTDASAAVPRDLLSSAPVSEEEHEISNEDVKGITKSDNKAGTNEKSGRKEKRSFNKYRRKKGKVNRRDSKKDPDSSKNIETKVIGERSQGRPKSHFRKSRGAPHQSSTTEDRQTRPFNENRVSKHQATGDQDSGSQANENKIPQTSNKSSKVPRQKKNFYRPKTSRSRKPRPHNVATTTEVEC